MKEIVPYLLPTLSFLLTLTVFITNERRTRQKEKKEREPTQTKEGAYPRRKDKHRKH